MKVKIAEVVMFIIAALIVFGAIYFMYSNHQHFKQKRLIDGKRYSELPIIKTVDKDSYIFYILGDDVNQIEVNKDYYEKVIRNYKDSQDGK